MMKISTHAALACKTRVGLTLDPQLEKYVLERVVDNNLFRRQRNGRDLYMIQLPHGPYIIAVFDPQIQTIVTFLPIAETPWMDSTERKACTRRIKRKNGSLRSHDFA